MLASPTPTSNGRSPGHAHSPSSASLLSTTSAGGGSVGGINAGRSPLATARVIGSPSELGDSFRFAKPEAVEASTRNKFKWGKGKSETTKTMATPTIPTAKSPTVARQGSIDQNSRQHGFQPVSILRPVRCDYCGDKMWGLNEVRCGREFYSFSALALVPSTDNRSSISIVCGSYAHAKCAGYLQGGCQASGSTAPSNQDDTLNFTPSGPPIFGGDLVS